MVNSGFLDGLDAEQSKFKMIRWLEEKGIGDGAVNYRMKDWVFSRQRYWGEPIPVVHCEKCGAVPVPESELPLRLPDVKNYLPTGTGESPLAAMEEWVNTKCPKCKGPAKRETNTMPQWGGSCWYYLRYISPMNSKAFADPKEMDYWMNVDLYVGGAEHAVLHLLYARFWHKVLFDLGFVKDKEPFKRLMNQGMILGEDNEKMSKSRGNVINPDDVIRQYGADTLRLYEMFMGPFDAVKPWSTKGIEGSFRFLQKVWRLLEEGTVTDEADSPAISKQLHKTIKKVGEDIEGMHFNTAISQMMILANDAMKEKRLSKLFLETFALILSPFAPHMAEELWEKLGHKETLAYAPWPAFDPALVVDDAFELVFAVNGKKRSSKQVPMGIVEADAISEAMADVAIQKNLEGKEVVKKIYVPGKLVNIVVR
jgi:leucyl-tRNA synthetase